MKPLLVILSLMGLGGSAFSQNFTYYRPGQSIPAGTEAGLLVRSEAKANKQIGSDSALYKDVSAVKFVGFDDADSQLDSMLQLVGNLGKLRTLVFENCDLTQLETPLDKFAALEELQVLKGSVLDENTFFPLLKHSTVQRIAFQTEDPDLVLDSLALVPQLQSLSVSNTGIFSSSNLKQKIPMGEDKRLVAIDYFGSFYKQNGPSGNIIRQINEPTAPVTDKAVSLQRYQSKLDCIKQPVPGIRINDTIYRIDSRRPGLVNYRSGTQLSIPADIFATPDGAPYNGPVTLFYREFRDPVEIMLSGIPMTVIDQGDTNLFKSGGMYDLQAYDKDNKPLTTTSDTAISLRFAMTDTSSTFKFYNLNNNGSWNTLSNTVTTVSDPSGSYAALTKAIREYYNTYQSIRHMPDTTRFEARFESKNYLYWYRKDNPKPLTSLIGRDTVPGYSTYNDTKSHRQVSAIFKVKYLRQTKDKELVFMLVPSKSYVKVPGYMNPLMNKTFLYVGTLSKAEFRQKFSKRMLCWDVRVSANGNILDFNIKTTQGFVALAGQQINLNDDRTYSIVKQSAVAMESRVNKSLRHEARNFNRHKKDKYQTRFDHDHNDLNHAQMNHRDNYAYKACLPFQNDKEKAMTQEEFIAYARPIYNRVMASNGWNLETTPVGQALLKSGLGVKNIDEYIHKGQMQPFYVKYNNTDEAVVAAQNNYMLFKSIHTVYPLNAYQKEGSLTGYYFKGHRNYVIRFSEETMQVTKPDELEQKKRSNKADLDYIIQYEVKGMDSNDIKRLIYQ